LTEQLNTGIDTSNLDNLRFRLTVEQLRGLQPDRIAWLKRLCQTNLRFLVNCVLRPARKFAPLIERVHGPMIDQFLIPNPDVPYDQWSPIKERVLLAFRGALKSTITGGWLVQVQLCEPDVRMLIMSGKLPHAKTILTLGSRPFASNEVLRFLFPEWAVDAEDLASEYFICPRRDIALDLRDPTLSCGTFESVKAGGHYELILIDDATNEINCATAELVEKNEQCYDDTYELVEPGGYRHFNGTRWAPDDSDLPEVIKRRGEEFFAENGERNTTYFIMPVWTVREDGTPTEIQDRKERDRRNMLRTEDVNLTWPEKLNTRFLWPKYRANPVKFNRQYLLRYKGSLTVESFPETLLLENTRPFHEGMPAPHDRFTVINWDLSGVWSGRRDKRASDFTMGFAACFELSTRRCFYYDADMEVFNSSTEMAEAIVDFYVRQLRIGPVNILSIEDKHGARLLQGEIDAIAKKRGVRVEIVWNIPPCVADVKNSMIIKLAGAMKRGLIQFATELPQRDEIFRQFKKWAPQHQRVKDDGPDCAAQIWEHYSEQIFPGAVINMRPGDVVREPEPMAEEQVDLHADEKENADFALLASMTAPHA
jgi:hypothetical protein